MIVQGDEGMRQKKSAWPAVAGAALCVLALAVSIVLQDAGYRGMLDGDISADLLLGKRQADTGSLIQMDWLYSTEVRIFSPNLFYALAFSLGAGYKWARIIGHAIGLALMMASCVFALRKAKASWAASLCASAMLAVTASPIYAYVISMGGFYLCHCILGFLALGLWLSAGEGGGGKKKSLIRAGIFVCLCVLLGFFSVRYVLCFVCPMLVVAVLDMLLAPHMSHSLHDRHLRLGSVTVAGFFACAAGYAASGVIMPHLFTSGVGAADSFLFGAITGEALSGMLFTILADCLKLLGWRGNVPVFSLSGMVNVCVGGVLALGALMTARVYRSLSYQERDQRLQKRLLEYAFAALAVNLLCFLFIEGTYLNRYLVLPAIFLVPAAAVVLIRERSMRLRIVFALLLCGQLGLGGVQMLRDAYRTEPQAELNQTDMMDAAAFLMEEGYTHGYGNFWTVRMLEELTEGKLTFAGINLAQTEEGAASPVSIDMIRWLEPDGASHIDACEDKVFLLLSPEESEQLEPWLALAGAELIYENAAFRAYGMESSQELHSQAMFLRMKLENARYEDGVYHMDAHARMRVPTGYREAGSYVLTFDCALEPATDSKVQAYATSGFEVIAEQPIVQGRNALRFDLEEDDKYFMILFTSAQAQALEIANPRLNLAE